MQPHRRQFIGLSAAGLTVAALGGCRRAEEASPAAFAWSPPRDGDGEVGLVREAWWRAALSGKPLLVVTIPDDGNAKREHGNAWGELLNHGSPRALANLAACQVVCASDDGVRRALAGHPGGLPSARIALLLEPHIATSCALDRELAPVAFEWRSEGDEYVAAVERRMGRLEADLGALIAPDRATLERRVREAGAYPTGAGPVNAQDMPSALLRLMAEDDDSLLPPLAERARAELTTAPPPGARWASRSGCGTEIEGEVNERAWACGMGHTPEVSRRFLYFFKDA